MEERELKKKQIGNAMKKAAGKRVVSNAKTASKEKLLQKLIGKVVVKFKKLNSAGQILLKHEKELDESNQVMKN